MSKIKEARKRIMGVIEEHNKEVKTLLSRGDYQNAEREAYVVKGLLKAWDIVWDEEREEYVSSSIEEDGQ